jgi:hypothetical protein
LEFETMKPFTLGAACALAACVLLSQPVLAQFGGAGGGMPGGAGATELMGTDQLNYQLNALQVDLLLSMAQATAWGPFADQVRALHADLARQRGRGVSASSLATGAALVTPGSMQAIRGAVDRSRNRMTAQEDLEAAAKAVYDQLSDEQKLRADLRMTPLLLPLLKG